LKFSKTDIYFWNFNHFKYKKEITALDVEVLVGVGHVFATSLLLGFLNRPPSPNPKKEKETPSEKIKEKAFRNVLMF
jgi:hypothetical protein